MNTTSDFNFVVVVLDILASWTRMLIALVLSILFSLAVGITAARNRKAESVIIPLLDVFQSIPILGFFPIVFLGILAIFPSQLGVNLSVIILIFTSMSWNITFAVYEAVKSIPQDYVDLSFMSQSGTWRRITSLYIPASMSRIAYNTQTSWAVGLFYLVSSEILTLGSSQKEVQYGIGAAIMHFATQVPPDWTGYTYSFIMLMATVVVWQFVFLREFSLWAERYKFVEEPRGVKRDPLMRFYSWVNHRSISKLFLLRQGRGVTRFSSSLARFRRGVKYAALIAIIVLFFFEFGAILSTTTASLSHLPSLATILGSEQSVLIALGFSFVRVWYVYFICVAISVPLGISVALHQKAYDGLLPLIETIASVPAPLLLPAIVGILPGQGEIVAAIIIFLGMIWYVIFNVMAGIRTLPAELFELKTEFHISNFQAWRNIYLPAIVTAFVTGSITAIGAAWNTLIVAEYFSPNGCGSILTQVGMGIGKTIASATCSGNLLTLTLAVVSMTILIVAFNLTVWRRVYHYTTKRYAYNR